MWREKPGTYDYHGVSIMCYTTDRTWGLGAWMATWQKLMAVNSLEMMSHNKASKRLGARSVPLEQRDVVAA